MNANLPAACAETDAFLVDLAFGEELSVPARAKDHLTGCERCRTELAELEKTRALAATLPLEEPSAELDANVLAALDAHFAGSDLSSHLKFPEPARDFAPMAAPAAASAPMAAPAPAPAPAKARPQLSVIEGEKKDSAPAGAAAPLRGRPKPVRRWLGMASAAAGLAVIAGGALFLTESGNLADQRPAAVPPAPAAVAPPVVAQGLAPDNAPAVPAEPAKPAEPPAQNLAEAKLAEKAEELRPDTLASGKKEAADAKGAADAERQAQAAELGMLVDRAQVVAKKKDAATVRIEKILNDGAPAGPAPAPMPATPLPSAPVAAAPKMPSPAPKAEAPARAVADDLGSAKDAASAEEGKMGLGGLGARGMGAGGGTGGLGSLGGASGYGRGAGAAPEAKTAAPRPTVDALGTLAKGRDFLGKGSYAAALAAFDRVLSSDADEASLEAALDGKVNALLGLHRYAEADQAAHELFRRAPGRADVLARVQRARAADAPKASSAAPADATK